MIELLNASSDKVFAMRVSGTLMHEDYQQFVPRLKKLIEEHGRVRCLVEMTGFNGIERRALWDEVVFDVRHGRQIERSVFVGDRARNVRETGTYVMGRPIFSRAEIRFYDIAEGDKAWEWTNEGL